MINKIRGTQDFLDTYYDCGHFYMGNAEAWKKNFDNVFNLAVEIPYYRAVDIDNVEDWKKAEYFYKISKIK